MARRQIILLVMQLSSWNQGATFYILLDRGQAKRGRRIWFAIGNFIYHT